VFSRLLSFASILLVLSTSLLTAAPTPWDAPAGATPDYSWSNGQNATGKLNSPLAVPGRFTFTTQTYTATSSNGVPAASSDTFSVHLNASGQKRFSTIEVNVLGDYALLGPASVNATGLLKVINNVTAAVINVPLVPSPGMPITQGFGIYTGNAKATLPADWKDIIVEFTHDLTAVSSEGSTGHIEAKSVIADVTVVPLPAAVLAAPAGFAMMFVARRKLFRHR
jgi:hypothetical protein